MSKPSKAAERRDYRILFGFVWFAILLGVPVSIYLVSNGAWWTGLPLVGLLVGSPLLFAHFTGFERHIRALEKQENKGL